MNTSKRIFQSNSFAMVLLILYALGGRLLMPIFNKLNLSLPYRIVLPQFILLLLPTIIYFIITKRSVVQTLRLKKIGMKTILIVVLIGLLGMPVAAFLSLITQFVFPNRISEVVAALNNIPFIIRVGIIAVTPAICEEITMRGVVLAGYDNVNIKTAAVMTGLFFGILHMDGNQFLYAFALGIIFAYLVRITDSIFSSMVCHLTINGTQLLLPELIKLASKGSNEEIKAAQKAGLDSFTMIEKINVISIYLILAIICMGIIILLIQKLVKIHGIKGIKVSQERKSVKVMNAPAYITIVLYVFIIVGQLMQIYKK
ncbi:type II CAAX endopeptidase family protein [Clostridium aestuarii]|uniref:Type II CAAX endopeptidase family protein n=1 Tax=Clostridium aestuarii TaxID=338193 RepID=A0ABT4D2V7_9CLOT|nr:type II CAAX endopeptidase family protein [Clostridium aestuarii]MCY6484987.1 type II CAAX endopeptidase family protein [Clostridium aestuarii]